ncbi:MAG: hypothetical protein FWE72_01590 [Spirochaetaceae bacterium]|nr:hypothetical protein [Spirochaetaceae bacterium]
MNISIDGNIIDYTLEKEKNSYEIIESISLWLKKNYIIIKSIKIDEKEYNYDDKILLSELSIDSINKIEVFTLTIREYKYNQLLIIQKYFEDLISLLNSNNKDDILKFLKTYERIKPDMEEVIDKIYKSENQGFIETVASKKELAESDYENLKFFTENIFFVIGERKREIVNPETEIEKEKKYFDAFLPEIEIISVLLQTGKQSEAFEKIIKFVDFAKKLSRLLSYYNMGLGKIEPEEISKYNKLLNDLGEALKRGDSVLIGDILEYELSPIIEQFFNIMLSEKQQEK